jgi:hypothetical protein
MKKLATLVFALMLTAGLSFAQTGGGATGTTTDKPAETGKAKGHKGGKKGHKGGKKGKKGEKTEATPAPK